MLGRAIIGRAREEGLSLEEVVDHAQALILRINRSERERGLVPFKNGSHSNDGPSH
ncbi:MAG: hypothetical protein KatS3mg115_0736 [Candidatus Poribacteria bacterium]|nr:MAG: hypothetical protein KatS3mg115_0736 [Candidatus Poribacteria bacterium]